MIRKFRNMIVAFSVFSLCSLHCESVRMAPDVTEEMLEPSFWISRAKNPHKVLVGPGQIKKFNEEISKTWCSIDPPYLMMKDLRKTGSFLSGNEIKKEIFHFDPKTGLYRKNPENQAHELTDEDRNLLLEKMNVGELGDLEAFTTRYDENDRIVEPPALSEKNYVVRKAVCVKRSDVKVFPEDRLYSTNPDYWFDDFDQNSAVLMNEPALVVWESKDKNWFLILTGAFSGWVKKESMAFVSDDEFSRYFDYSQNNFITITEDRFSIPEKDCFPFDRDEKIPELFMGTKIFIRDWDDFEHREYFSPRVPHNCYIGEIPVRNEDGWISFRHALISAGVCSRGFLPYTSANTLTLAFRSLGNSYGWGGMNGNRDCTAFSGDIFRCFGFNFARNSKAQIEMPGKTYWLEGKSVAQKEKIFDRIPAGTLLGFKGHVFIYIGKSGGKHYAINSAGGYISDINDPSSFVDAESVHVVCLDILKRNRKSFADSC